MFNKHFASSFRDHSIQSGLTNLLVASYFKFHSHLSILFPLLCVLLPHSIIVSIYLFYSPSAPKLCHPTIPPTPCALTALSLDGRSSSKAVTMMDCRLPQPLPLPFSLFCSALAVKALTRSRVASVSRRSSGGTAPVTAVKVVGGSFHQPPRWTQHKPRAIKPWPRTPVAMSSLWIWATARKR